MGKLNSQRKVMTVVTAITGHKVVIGDLEIEHAQKHFYIPKLKLVEVVEQILIDPSDVFVESSGIENKNFYLFYRLENNNYLVVVIKNIDGNSFFVTVYPTGTSIKLKHKKLKRVKI